MTDKPELLPCPFCGAPLPFLIQADLGDWYVSCGACTQWARPIGAGTYELAIAAWNRRAPRFTPEEIEAMENAAFWLERHGGLVGDPTPERFFDTKEIAATLRKMLEEK